jgi:hypothetical protein
VAVVAVVGVVVLVVVAVVFPFPFAVNVAVLLLLPLLAEDVTASVLVVGVGFLLAPDPTLATFLMDWGAPEDHALVLILFMYV